MTDASCSCPECVELCKRRPCWGTPQEIEKIIDAGYAEFLMVDYWVGEKGGPDIPVIAPAMGGHEMERAPWILFDSPQCVFLVDGLCLIHDIKPLEGRMAFGCDKRHAPSEEYRGPNPHKGIAMMWRTVVGKRVVAKWREAISTRSQCSLG